MSNFEDKLKQLNKSLEPTLNQKKAIKNSLFNDLNLMENINKKSVNLFGFKGWVIAICSILVFILVPSIFFSYFPNAELESSVMQDAEIISYEPNVQPMQNEPSGGLPQSVGSDDEMFKRSGSDGFDGKFSSTPDMFGVIDKEEGEFLGVPETQRRKDVNALYSVLVKDLDSAYLEIKNFIIESDGFVKFEDKSNYSGIKYSKLLFELPQDKFSEFQAKMDGWAVDIIIEELKVNDREIDMQESESQISDIQLQIDEMEIKQNLSESEKHELERLKILVQKLQEDLDSKNVELRYVTIELEMQEMQDESISNSLKEFSTELIDNIGKVMLFWIYIIGYFLIGIIALSPILLSVYVLTRIFRKKSGSKSVSRENKPENLPKK